MSHDPSNIDFTPPELQEISQLLPAYEIISFIAKGGMGAVYMAKQKSLDREVAIKVLPRHFGEDEEFRASFETEAKSMAKLNHPNLIGIYDFGQIDGLLYIIMEMVQGKSLYYSSYGKIIDPDEATRIVSEICHGLAHAHQSGILHRDIKPANILLDSNASPKIGDFGLARPVEDHESDTAFGTPGYTAPEVIHDPSAVDDSTDIYSVGVILYELLTGKLPDPDYTTAASLVGCDPRFDEVILKAMHPNPSERYRSAEAMADALGKIGSSPASTSPTLATPAPVPTQNFSTRRPSTSVSTVNTGSNMPVIRNLLIIVALLASIYIAWEILQKTKAKRAAEIELTNEQNEGKNPTPQPEAIQNKPTPKPDTNTSPPAEFIPVPVPVPVVPKVETPLETLSRLKTELAKGSRTEMPNGTITHDNTARFFVDEKMTWHDAREFSEAHGGHLAILPALPDLSWLTSKLKPDQTIWLGAGNSGKENWCWIDGTVWNHSIRDTSKSSYVITDDTGILNPESAQAKHSFFIEWNMDGSTPATLENQLKRSASTLSTETPIFPAGTVTYMERHYLLIQKNIEWQAALELAKLAGGTLATPSDSRENEWMLSYLSSALPPDKACWIGGTREPNQSWKWITEEPWEFATWGKGLPNEDEGSVAHCAALSSSVWDDFPADSTQPFFLIEWSEDSQNSNGDKTENNDETADTSAVVALRNKCAELIIAMNERYETEYISNIKGFEQELGVYHRSLGKNLQETYAPHIQAMQSNYENNRIPSSLSRENMPSKLAEILDSRFLRQHEISNKLIADAEKLRAKYLENLRKISKEYSAKGLTTGVREAKRELRSSRAPGLRFMKRLLDRR